MKNLKKVDILEDILNSTPEKEVKDTEKEEYKGCDAFYADHWLMNNGSFLSTKEPGDSK